MGIAVVGFGRIGRSMVKVALKHDLFSPAAIADIRDASYFTRLFAFDTNYGRWPEPVNHTPNSILIGQREIQFLNSSMALPDWGALGVDVVVDCTGRATTRSGAQAHLARGAKTVLVSAASKSREDADAVLLPGINLDEFDPRKHRIVSMASCTTNALAPVVSVLRRDFGIGKGFFATVHAYTNTQSLTDQPKADLRDSWSASENIIPSASGAAKALQYIWPDLKITGKAYRVPVRTGSIAELNVTLNRQTSVDEVKDAFRRASHTPPLQGILGVLEDEWASTRIVGETLSSVVDLPLVQVLDGDMLSIAAWYDNEMGYAARLAEAAAFLSQTLQA